jgi:hypothetical protein
MAEACDGPTAGLFHGARRALAMRLCWKVLAAGTGFTDTMIRRGRYPDYKGPLPFTIEGEMVAVCIPLAYLTAFQMLTRYRNLPRGCCRNSAYWSLSESTMEIQHV